MGILIAIPIVLAERADVLALPDALHLPGAWGEFGGLVLLAGIAVWLFRIGTRKPA
jgi:hypothetical protein